jgi:PAS domain S-box-containing protein
MQLFGQLLIKLCHMLGIVTIGIPESDANHSLRFKSLFDSTLIGIAFWREDGTITEANKVFSDLLGYSRNEISNAELTWSSLTEVGSKTLVSDALVKTRAHGASVLIDTELLAKNGSVVPVTIDMVRSGSSDSFGVAIISDRTEKFKKDIKIAAHTRDLENSNRDLQEFAYVASHDLQEPLRMVSSYVQLLSERYKGKLDSDADDFIAFASDGAKRMKQLIDDLLAFARLQKEKSEFAVLKRESVLADALVGLELSIDETGAEISHDPLPELLGNGSQLRQLFQNLIANAIKFRGALPPSIHISAERILSGRSESEWRFAVRDNGIGIEKEFASKIFDVFQRLHSTEKYSGSGIGLAICRRIAGLHGGNIWVESEFGRGSTFYFSLNTERMVQT